MKQDQLQAQAVFQRPVKYIENVFGPDVRPDYSKMDLDVQDSFLPKYGKDRIFKGSLPYTTSPKLYRNVQDRMIPEETRISKVCWNDALADSGPWYLRHWQIWDGVPFLPTTGDVAKDPRYGKMTNDFTRDYVTKGL